MLVFLNQMTNRKSVMSISALQGKKITANQSGVHKSYKMRFSLPK